MIKYFEDVKEIFEAIEKLHNDTTNYLNALDAVEHRLSDLFTESTYVDYITKHMNFLQEKFLGEELYGLIIWYLFDRPEVDVSAKDTHYNIESKGVKYLITDMKSLLDYVRVNYNFPSKLVEK